MSNRGVQSAQRRRAGPTNAEPAIPGRGPQPSINSSKIFTGQKQQQQQPSKQDNSNNLSKITIAQAITLITLRLGSVETKLMHMQENGGFSNSYQLDGQTDVSLIDKSVIESITSRLESLEKRSTNNSTSGPEINLLKQQFETIKQAVIKTNSVTSTLAKDNRDLKSQVENLKQDLHETKELLNALQNLTMENNNKLLAFPDDEYLEESQLTNLPDNIENNEILGTDLKALIENEISANIS